MATSLKVNAASFISPGDLAKAQHMIDREASKSGEILMRTAAHSIASGIRHWASSNRTSFQQDIDKALQPFLNSMEKQVLKTLGGARATSSTPVARHASSSAGASAPNYSTITQAQWNAMPSSTAKPNVRTGGGGTGHAASEAFGVAMTMEAVHTMYEQIAEVRNEMYSGNIKASNLQRQLGLPASTDIRGFTESIAKPGMEMGYTKTEAMEAAQSLIRSGGSRTAAEVAGTTEEMFKFASARGFEAPDWAGVVSGGQRAGLFGAGAGNLGYGAKGIEEYQTRASGLYGMASKQTGGNRGTTEFLDTFTESLNSLASALGDATGNSEDAAKSFDNLDVKGNVYSMFSALQGTGNQAFTGQKGVQLLSQVNSSIQNQVFGDPMQQAMAFATHPGMSMGQIFAAQSKGLTDPKEFASQMKFINANYKGEDRELALHRLYGTSYGAGKALEDIYAKTGGKGTTKDELEAASKIQGYGEDSQAKVYRTAMDALTKSMEEMSQILAPVIVGFDKLQGATHGLAGIFLMTFGAMKGKRWLEGLLGGEHHGKNKHGGLIGEIAELAKGKGQPVYITNDCLKVCGSTGGMDPTDLLGNKGVKNAEKEVLKDAEKNIFGRMFGRLKTGGVSGALGEIGDITKEVGWKGFAGKLWSHGPVAALGFGKSLLGRGAGMLRGIAGKGAGRLGGSLTEKLLNIGGRVSTGNWASLGEVAGEALPEVAGAGEVVGGAAAGTAGVGASLVMAAPLIAGTVAAQLMNVDVVKEGKQLFKILGDSKLRSKFASSLLPGMGTAFRNIPGIGHMYDFLDSKNNGPVNQEADRHKKELERKRLEHNKAANKEWERMLGKALDPSNPLSGVVKATMTGDWGSFLKDIWNGASKFFKGFIKNLGDLWSKLFGSKPPGHPAAPHHPHAGSATGHPHSGAVTATSPSGGSTVTLAPIKLHITVQDSHGHTSTKVVDHHPLRTVANPHKITIGPQHHTQPQR